MKWSKDLEIHWSTPVCVHTYVHLQLFKEIMKTSQVLYDQVTNQHYKKAAFFFSHPFPQKQKLQMTISLCKSL